MQLAGADLGLDWKFAVLFLIDSAKPFEVHLGTKTPATVMPELPVKFEISRLSRPDVFMIFAPLLPGGILLSAVVLCNWPLASKFITSAFWGHYSKITILALAAHVLGSMVMLLALCLSWFFARGLERLISAPKLPSQGQPWNALEWRRLARLFIGPTLTPETDRPLDAARFQAASVAVEQIANPEEKRAALRQLAEAHATLLGADIQWMNWYYILKNYVVNAEAVKEGAFTHQIAYLFHALSLSGLLALVALPGARNWILWVLFGFGEIYGLLYTFWINRALLTVPIFDNVMAAQMLAIVRSENQSAIEKQSAAGMGGRS